MRFRIALLWAGVAVLLLSGCNGSSALSGSSPSASARSGSVQATASSTDSPYPRHGSSITVKTGDDVKVLIADLRGDAGDVLARVVLTRDPNTTCLTNGKVPIALPVGTSLEGSGDTVTVVGPDGRRYRIGDEIQGSAMGSTRANIEADYGALPTDCGPPPWVVIHGDLGPASSP